jgi:hypothetical protein
VVILLGSHIGEHQLSNWAVILVSLRIFGEILTPYSLLPRTNHCPERLEKDGNLSKLWEENDFRSQSSLVQKSHPAYLPS